MFVMQKNRVKLGLIMSAMTVLGATNAVGGDKVNDADIATIPVTVELSALKIGEAPLYISIQTRKEFRGIRGQGGIIKLIDAETMTQTFNVKEAGDYAVSVWHDLDDDGVFSMDDSYNVLDGWGSSGDIPVDREPTFDDTKVRIETYGATIPITLNYLS